MTEKAKKQETAKDAKPAEAAQNPHLRLWDQLKRTDPKATKPFTRGGGFRGTQIDPTWRMQRMTEVFGPIGIGWGYEQLDVRVMPEPNSTEAMVFISVRVWYREPDTGEKAWTGPQWGGTELYRRRRDGSAEPNDESFKMSITDALGKCLLQLGVAADVYLGLFDDSKYREETETYYANKNDPELQPAAIAGFEKLIREKLAEVTQVEALDALWREGVGERLRAIGTVDGAARQRITALFSNKKAELLKADGAENEKQPEGKTNGAATNGHRPAQPAPDAVAPKQAAPPHDPATGEVKGPHCIPMPMKGEKKNWVAWGGSLIAALKASKTRQEAMAWMEACGTDLADAREAGLKVYHSIKACYDEVLRNRPNAEPRLASPADAGTILSGG